MIVQVCVTADDIKHGRRGALCRCPVARALHRAIPASRIDVGDSGAACFDGERWMQVELPSAVTRFIHAFDDRQPVKPFDFEIEVEA